MVCRVVCLFLVIVVGTVSAMPSDDFRAGSQLSHRERRVKREQPSFGPDFTHFEDDFQEAPLARSASKGFIQGKPSNFPSFASLGGFEPLSDNPQKKSNFIPDFQVPSVAIPDISEAQPVLTSENFPSRKDTKEIQSRNQEDKKELKDTTADLASEESHHHLTVARKGAEPVAHHSHTRAIRQFPFLSFAFPGEQRERAESNNPHLARDFFAQEQQSAVNPNRRRYQLRDDEGFAHESQRFYPSFNPHPPKRGSHLSQSFFPSGHHAGVRGGGSAPFASRRPSFRSHGGHEAVNVPKFAFAANKFKERNVDKKILGSGNFEIIKGGTFYDDDNPHRNHNPYDPYLENSYVVFPSGNPHNHNQVDDYFSNFRDFSEFANRNRRSGSVHFGDPSDGFLEPGFASEHVAHFSKYADMMTSESGSQLNDTRILSPLKGSQFPVSEGKYIKKNKNEIKLNPTHLVILINTNRNIGKTKTKPIKPKKLKKYNLSTKKPSSKLSKTKNKRIMKNKKAMKYKKRTKRPRNIQEVLEEIDPFPSPALLKKDTTDEIDPMIATF